MAKYEQGHKQAARDEIVRSAAERFRRDGLAAVPPGGTSCERTKRAHAIFASMIGSLQMMRITTEAEEIEMHMTGGRDAALLIANQPWH